jgi:hypothetical protein
MPEFDLEKLLRGMFSAGVWTGIAIGGSIVALVLFLMR